MARTRVSVWFVPERKMAGRQAPRRWYVRLVRRREGVCVQGRQELFRDR